MRTQAPSTVAELSLSAAASVEEVCALVTQNEHRVRAATAQAYVHAFQFVLAYAREQRKTFTAAELSVAYLQQADKGRLLRKAGPAYAQLTRTTDRRAQAFLLASVNLVQHSPELLDRLWTGEIPVGQVQVAAEKLASLTPPPQTDGTEEEAKTVEEQHKAAKNRLGAKLCELADPGLAERDFRSAANRLRDEHHPDDATTRHRKAAQRRFVRISAAPDGMAKLFAHIPADAAAEIESILVEGTRAVAHGNTAHTRTQHRADLFIRLLTRSDAGANPDRGPGSAPTRSTSDTPPLPGFAPAPDAATCSCGSTAPPPRRRFFAYLLMPFDVWIKLGGRVATGELGFLRRTHPELFRLTTEDTPISSRAPAQRAPKLLGSPHDLSEAAIHALLPEVAMLQAVLTHPATGYPVGLSVRTRRPSPRTRDLLLLRDQRCRFPGCDVPGNECEVDHVTDFALGGTSDLHGLALLCKRHHGGKSAGWWRVRPRPDLGDGVLEFHFPQTGRTELSAPELPLDERAWQDIRHRLETPPF